MTPESAENLAQLFFAVADDKGDAPFLWSKKGGAYRSVSWAAAKERVVRLAAALRRLGAGPGDRVILLSENRPEWPIADFAVMSLGAITTPAYVTNTVLDHGHVISDSGAKGAIVSTGKLADVFLKAALETDGLDFVVAIEDAGIVRDAGVPIYDWDNLVAEPPRAEDEILNSVARLKRTDTACVIYTSGTGGTPKGVMLSHGSQLHNCAGAIDVLKGLELGHEVFLSFLPLSHSYEHMAGQFFPVSIGAEIYYAEGVETLAGNMLEARPTIMTAVPRLYEILHQKIVLGMRKAGGRKRKLFERAVALGTKRYEEGRLSFPETVEDFFLGAPVRRKVAERFGGRLKALVSGGAPLNPDIALFFTALGIRILQGYGQTESAPLVSVNPPNKVKIHTVGPAIKNTDLKIAEDGEIRVKGELVMQGYWNNSEATKDVVGKDGWLRTGDIGEIDKDGFITITDRKKDIIVNSGGDNISPQRVEGLLCLNAEIAQAMVHGDKRPYLVAAVVPDEIWLKNRAKARGLEANPPALKDDPDLHRALAKVIDETNKSLSIVERIKRFIVVPEGFTIENGMLTPTMKIRRHVIKRVYGKTLENLYAK